MCLGNPLEQKKYSIGQIFIFVNGQILKNLVTWPH